MPGHLQALESVLGNGTSSLFSQHMLNSSVVATASAKNLVPFPGDSFSEQIGNHTGPHTDAQHHKVPLGLSVGVPVAGAAVLAAAAILGIYILRHRRPTRQKTVGPDCTVHM